MTDLRDLAESAAMCTPAELEAVYAALPHPLPPVRRALDEARPIEPELYPENPHTHGGALAAGGLATACLIAGFIFT